MAALLSCRGGTLRLPEPGLLLLSRLDGGHLIVEPPRPVSERSELSASELASWGALTAAAGGAMLDVLSQLFGGCINYWDAGNWSLHGDAEPKGPKTVAIHRRVHVHLLGRSRHAQHPSWQWGEAPMFPRFEDRQTWASGFDPLTPHECDAIVEGVLRRLRTLYDFSESDLAARP